MSGRVRTLLILAILVVIIGVGAAVVLPALNSTPPATEVAGEGTPQATTAPGETPVATVPAATAIPTLDIVVAIRPIGRGQVINPDMVAFRTWPEEYAARNAIFSLDDVVGKIARTDIVPEQPILTGLITDNLSGLGQVGSDAAALIPAGTRMVAVPIDRLRSAGYAIQPGDRVDAIISLLFVDLDEEFQSILPNNIHLISRPEPGVLQIVSPIKGRAQNVPFAGEILPALISPVEDARPRLSTQMTIQDALVIHVGTFPDDGRLFGKNLPTPIPQPQDVPTEDPTARNTANGTPVPTAVPLRPDIIEIAVSPQDAVVMTYFVEAKIPINFALRPAAETGTVTTQPVSLDFIMRRYSIVPPTRLAYSVEPAIRSIRQLSSADEITFRPANAQQQQGGGTGQ